MNTEAGRQMDWYTCSKTFIKVVDEKGFAAASRKLYTTQSSISKRIAWLENMLDNQLLTRSTRRLDLTEAGQKYYNQVLPLIDEWDELKRDMSSDAKLTKGNLTVAIPTIGGNHFISQLIPKFLKKYPEIKLTMRLTNRAVSLIEEKIDLYISPEDLGNHASNSSEQLNGPCRKLYASPDYLATHGEPTLIEELENHNCLVHTASIDNMWKFQDAQVAVNGGFRSNNTDMLIKAAVAGLGIIFVVEPFVTAEIQNNQLKVLLPQYASANLTLYASYPAHKYLPQKTQVFIDFLKKELIWPQSISSG